MTLFGRNNNNSTATANNTVDGTQQQHAGFGAKIQNLLHHRNGQGNLVEQTAPVSTVSTPAPMIDSSLRSTNIPIHTNPGTIQGQGLNQGIGLNQGLNQGVGLNQGGFNQGGFNQGLGLNQGLNQGGFSQGGFNQGGFNQGGFSQGGFNQGLGLNQGLSQGGLVQITSELKQGLPGQNHLFLQGAAPSYAQQNVAPMHTAPGAHNSFLAAPVGAVGAGGLQGVAHQPLLVNKKLRSTITDTSLAQPIIQQQQFVAPIQQQFVAPIQQQRQFIPTETHVRPTIVEEVQRAERLVEVQPIIHREVEAPEVRVIEQHIYETVPHTGPAFINKPAIVEETVRPRIIEEVHPVIHREVPAPFVQRVEQHINERVVQPTVMTKEVINDTRTQFVPAGGIAAGGPIIQPVSSSLNQGNIPVAPPMPARNISSSSRRRW